MRPVGKFTIRPATSADVPAVREMMREYVDWIALDLAFQEIDEELAGLPGEYAPPGGALFVATDGSQLVAMIGLRPLHEPAGPAGLSTGAQSAKVEARSSKVEGQSAKAGEMKRLFVRPAARGQGVAKALVARVIDEARRLGYAELRLDTLPMMGDAQALYAAMGFADIEAYYDTPIAGTRFMAKRL
jgi:GNAT superfamily N-acetyltransferase